jgi:hypothetical protein
MFLSRDGRPTVETPIFLAPSDQAYGSKRSRDNPPRWDLSGSEGGSPGLEKRLWLLIWVRERVTLVTPDHLTSSDAIKKVQQNPTEKVPHNRTFIYFYF